ncbi:MAG: flagellar biosynthesis anti-sigma factor FlgM [Deltaproteobacteria bacterium]|nr:flagellar biosynthesis anti-sigma factor FlgM [Deltaproteobacteria bacterium]
MRITRRTSIPGLPDIEDPGAVAPAPSFTPPLGRRRDAEGSADRVELSEGARLRQRLRADLGDVEQPDSSRVLSLRARVVANAYRPAPDAVAKSLVGELTADLVV